VVTAAMLSPQMVQALARQVHASIEQRAGIDRYRRGR
jgi:formate hydrogenlyase subunit 4